MNTIKKKSLPSVIKNIVMDKKAMFIMIVLACSLLNITYMHVCIYGIDNMMPLWHVKTCMCFAWFDILIIYLLPLLFVRKHVSLFILPYSLLTILVWVNVGYSRYFNTYIPLSLFASAGNLQDFTSNVLDAIGITDIFLLFTTLTVVTSYIFLRRSWGVKRSDLYPLILGLFLGVFFFVKYATGMVGTWKTIYANDPAMREGHSVKDILTTSYFYCKPSQKDTYFNYGFTVNYIVDYLSMNKYEPFPKELEQYVCSPKTSVKANSVNNNFILILVESLSSFAINKEYGGVEITPNLNKLANEGIYYPKMESEAQLGQSSDGQLIYMLGILPLKDMLTIDRIASNRVFSLAHAFKSIKANGKTRMIIPTPPDVWAQETMCKKYGIDTLYACNEIINDDSLFKKALEHDAKEDETFFSVLLTSSTHSPYNKSIVDYQIAYPSDFSEEFKNYLNNVHYMDECLGYYIQQLKIKNIYDETVIMILADHKPIDSQLNKPASISCSDIPMIIVNLPSTVQQVFADTSSRIYQTSVYPTILDIWGIENKWRGVGHSLLPTIGNKQRDKKLQQHLSESLIYSDYFYSYK